MIKRRALARRSSKPLYASLTPIAASTPINHNQEELRRTLLLSIRGRRRVKNGHFTVVVVDCFSSTNWDCWPYCRKLTVKSVKNIKIRPMNNSRSLPNSMLSKIVRIVPPFFFLIFSFLEEKFLKTLEGRSFSKNLALVGCLVI